MKRKIIVFCVISICVIGTLASCTDSKVAKEDIAGENIESSVDKNIDKEINENIDKGENTNSNNNLNSEDNTDSKTEKDEENYYSKHDNFYNGTHILSVDFKGEGIGDSFLDYTFKINGKGNLSVEIASLRGSFKGDIDAIPSTFREWKGTIKSVVENEKIDVEVRITDHALVVVEKESETKQVTKFYYESKTFDLEHVDKDIYTDKGTFELKKK
ncbi:MAG: hypothetical protein ACRCTZ_07505 [Sarcina sp.]